MKKPFYIYIYLISNFIGLFSRGIHFLVFFGHPSRTTSARSYIEYARKGKWNKRRALINKIFFWQKDHCLIDWKLEVERAKETLKIEDEINELYRNR